MTRSQKIQSILDARKPMAEKVAPATETLNSIEQQVSSFRDYIPSFAAKLDPDAKHSVESLIRPAETLLLEIRGEQPHLAQLAYRYERSTLNIGVVGSARQGKSTLLQQFTGLSTHEIPSGDKGFCTGAASIVINQDTASDTYAEIVFHTPHSFIEEVVKPFYIELDISPVPNSLDDFSAFPLPDEAPKENEKSAHAEIIKRLRELQRGIPHYRQHLNGSSITITKDQIRNHVAQESVDGREKFYTWMAVVKASIYCKYPHSDVGSVAFADTPGIGDFISGAEERLVKTVGRNLDAVLMLRRPPPGSTIIAKEDNTLYDLMKKAIPELDLKEWSYFIANKSTENSKNMSYYLSEVLGKSSIVTRSSYAVDCTDLSETSAAFDGILTDIAGNLSNLDRKLFDRRAESLHSLGSSIQAFADKAANSLPRAGVARPDSALLTKLFNQVWENLGAQLKQLVGQYRQLRDEPDAGFLAAVNAVFEKLDEGPGLPEPEQIEKEAATGSLMKWHADRLNALRVKVAGAFESVDHCLNSGFVQLREDILSALQTDEGGRLGRLDSVEGDAWQTIRNRMELHEDGEVMAHAVDMLLTAGLSFRGFIQPRVRHCLDVLDSDSTASGAFLFAAGDTAEMVRDKLEMAWQNACFNCRSIVEDMAREPAMAHFAAAEDFREAVLHSGGESAAKDLWRLFYEENRPEVWPDEFTQLESETRLRKEWENSVKSLQKSAKNLAVI